MDGFTYHNIFDTKGIEYLVIIAFLLLLIPFWLILNNQGIFAGNVRNAIGTLSTQILKIPKGLFYSKNHMWAFLERSGTAKIGLNDLLVHLTGEVDLQYVKAPGEKVKKGDAIAEIVQNGKKLYLKSPVSGEIVEMNSAVAMDPVILNKDPYGAGWILTVRPDNWVAETSCCFLAGGADQWIKKELSRIKDFVAMNIRHQESKALPVILQDGGELPDHVLTSLPPELWDDFQKEFMEP